MPGHFIQKTDVKLTVAILYLFRGFKLNISPSS